MQQIKISTIRTQLNLNGRVSMSNLMVASGDPYAPKKKLSAIKAAADNATSTAVRYPPAALTGQSTTLSGKAYGNGTYGMSASTEYGPTFASYLAFNYNDAAASGWASSASKYVSATGVYKGTASTSGYSGEYIEILMPVSIIMKYYIIVPSAQDIRCSPRNFRWYGSSDNGATWTMIDERTSQNSWTVNVPVTYTCASLLGPFNRFRFVVNQTTNIDLIWINELKIYA